MDHPHAPTAGGCAGAVVTAPAETPVPHRSAVLAGEAGMATAEYAIATLAACGFAGLLVAILTSDQVRGLLLSIIQRALSLA